MTEVVALTARSESEADLDEAMIAWWSALLTHASTTTDAGCLVADAWGETGRLIGHVQRADEPIGTDRGLRVVLSVPALAASVQEAGFDSSALHASRETLFRAFERSRKRLVGEGRFASLWGGSARCLYCEDGAVIADPSLAPRLVKAPAKNAPAKKAPAKTAPTKTATKSAGKKQR